MNPKTPVTLSLNPEYIHPNIPEQERIAVMKIHLSSHDHIYIALKMDAGHGHGLHQMSECALVVIQNDYTMFCCDVDLHLSHHKQ